MDDHDHCLKTHTCSCQKCQQSSSLTSFLAWRHLTSHFFFVHVWQTYVVWMTYIKHVCFMNADVDFLFPVTLRNGRILTSPCHLHMYLPLKQYVWFVLTAPTSSYWRWFSLCRIKVLRNKCNILIFPSRYQEYGFCFTFLYASMIETMGIHFYK